MVNERRKFGEDDISLDDIVMVCVFLVVYLLLFMSFVKLWIGEFVNFKEWGRSVFLVLWKGYISDDELDEFDNFLFFL